MYNFKRVRVVSHLPKRASLYKHELVRQTLNFNSVDKQTALNVYLLFFTKYIWTIVWGIMNYRISVSVFKFCNMSFPDERLFPPF